MPPITDKIKANVFTGFSPKQLIKYRNLFAAID